MSDKVGAHQPLADRAGRASPEPQSTQGLGHSATIPSAGWQHTLENGAIDHEWVTEFGVTFCRHCEQAKDFSE